MGERAWDRAPEQVRSRSNEATCGELIGDCHDIGIDPMNCRSKHHPGSRSPAICHCEVTIEFAAIAGGDFDGLAQHRAAPCFYCDRLLSDATCKSVSQYTYGRSGSLMAFFALESILPSRTHQRTPPCG